MSNSIRTPKVGKTATSRRIAEAVDNEEWQAFRVSMKGTTTGTKLRMLMEYYEYASKETHQHEVGQWDDCDICVRVDNYIKAMCRGGLLFPGVSLESCLEKKWYVKIKK